MEPIKEKRNLSGLYVPYINLETEQREERVFEDLSEREMDEELQTKSLEELKYMCKELALTLRKVGDDFDIISQTE